MSETPGNEQEARRAELVSQFDELYATAESQFGPTLGKERDLWLTEQIAELYVERGELTKALKAFEDALTVAYQYGDTEVEVRIGERIEELTNLSQ